MYLLIRLSEGGGADGSLHVIFAVISLQFNHRTSDGLESHLSDGCTGRADHVTGTGHDHVRKGSVRSDHDFLEIIDTGLQTGQIDGRNGGVSDDQITVLGHGDVLECIGTGNLHGGQCVGCLSGTVGRHRVGQVTADDTSASETVVDGTHDQLIGGHDTGDGVETQLSLVVGLGVNGSEEVGHCIVDGGVLLLFSLRFITVSFTAAVAFVGKVVGPEEGWCEHAVVLALECQSLVRFDEVHRHVVAGGTHVRALCFEVIMPLLSVHGVCDEVRYNTTIRNINSPIMTLSVDQ